MLKCFIVQCRKIIRIEIRQSKEWVKLSCIEKYTHVMRDETESKSK